SRSPANVREMLAALAPRMAPTSACVRANVRAARTTAFARTVAGRISFRSAARTAPSFQLKDIWAGFQLQAKPGTAPRAGQASRQGSPARSAARMARVAVLRL